MRRIVRAAAVAAAGVLGAGAMATGAGAQGSTGPASGPGQRQAEFTAAANRSGVPADVLLAVSYQETRWEAHAGAPSTSGAYGPMALTDVAAATRGAKAAAPEHNQRGDGVPRPAATPAGAGVDGAAQHTARTAAALLGVDPATVRGDEATNIDAGAALLARYARDLGHGSLPGSVDGWYGAVAKYAQASTQQGAQSFADAVYGTIAAGAHATTADGQRITLTARKVTPKRAEAAGLGLPKPASSQRPECPRGLDCDFVPAAYQLDGDGSDPGNYGNYDLADRPKQVKIDTIVLHDTEETYSDTLDTFTNPASYVSAHYVVRSGDGHVTQMVPTSDVAWQAGNWYINSHSIGIEQEGFAVAGATWFTEPLYHSTARLVRYLAARYGVPLDRQHILGHDNVPGINAAGIPGMHWDPGPFWDWNHFMNLVGRPTIPLPGRHVVTINPRFAANEQQVRDCEQNTPVAKQASSFVWLRTGPSDDAPLFDDPGLDPKQTGGTDCAADWGDKASAGQQYVVAGRDGRWIAIWYDGAKVWFDGTRAVSPTRALVVRPKPGKDSVPTYGVAYPEKSAYPAEIPPASVTPLTYTIHSGQSYVYGGRAVTDYYYAKTIDDSIPGDHTDVHGHDRYLRIQLGHRIAFVNADDVVVVPA